MFILLSLLSIVMFPAAADAEKSTARILHGPKEQKDKVND